MRGGRPGGGQPSAVPPPGAGEPPPIEGYAVDGPESGRGRNIAAGFLALLGAALIIVGSFVPWVDVDGGDAEQLVENTLISGWETSEGEVGDGVVFAVVGGMAAIIGLIILFNGANLVLKIVLILLGLVAAGLALIEAVDIADLAQEIEDFPGDAQSTFGAGLIVIWAGAVFDAPVRPRGQTDQASGLKTAQGPLVGSGPLRGRWRSWLARLHGAQGGRGFESLTAHPGVPQEFRRFAGQRASYRHPTGRLTPRLTARVAEGATRRRSRTGCPWT